MMGKGIGGFALGLVVLLGGPGPGVPARGAELVTLAPHNFEEYAPPGKKAKAIFGDYVLRNEHLTAVVGDPALHIGRSGGRNFYPTPHGRLIDFTLRDAPNDLLDMFDPACCGKQLRPVLAVRPNGIAAASHQEEFRDEAEAWREPGREPVTDKRVVLRIPMAAPVVEVRYILEDGWQHLLVETDYALTKRQDATSIQAGGFIQVSARELSREGPFLWGRVAERELLWVYDPESGQAYGVQSADGSLAYEPRPIRQTGLWWRYRRSAGTDEPPQTGGGILTVRHRVYAGRDVFQVRAAAEALDGTLTQVRIDVTAPDGPVAGAVVTADRDGVRYAAGKTDQGGVLSCALPTGVYQFEVNPYGRPPVALTIDTQHSREHQVTCEAAGRVVGTVTDTEGKPLPCKVRFDGRGETPDPVLGSMNGEHLAGNVVYSETGAFSQVLPPGDYTATVSRGPEYTIAVAALTVERGRRTPLQAALQRVVKTPGWISANFGNLTAASSRFSEASAKGRVLNLLAEGIEFAPSTDYDTITDLSPAVRELGADAWLSTCPGVCLYWQGRKYAQRFHTAFPLPPRPGVQDGGMLQRPQHVMVKSWLARWDTGSRKVIIIDEPTSSRVFLDDLDGDHQPDTLPGVGNDVMDVHSLMPLVDGDAQGRRDRRVLDWLAALRLGYRLKGIVNSADSDTFHGNARWRNYVASPTDDPARIQTSDVVDSLENGRIVMTSGPFLDVSLRVAGRTEPAIPGDEVSAPDGRAALSVRVRAPDWIRIDEVRVLVNGEVTPALCFDRASQPERFGPAPEVFTETVPLELGGDAFIVVTAFGTNTAAGARRADASDLDVQVAASNPIWVDAGGDGYRPSPPLFGRWRVILGGAQSVGSMWQQAPVSARPGAEPGVLRMPIENRTDDTIAGTLSFRVRPEGAVRFGGGKQTMFRAHEARYQAKTEEVNAVRMVDNALDYRLGPREKLIVEFEVSLAEHQHPGGFFLYVPRNEDQAISMVGHFVEVSGYACPVLKQTPKLAAVGDALGDAPSYVVASDDGTRMGEVRFAVAAGHLVLEATVEDAGPAPGSRVTVCTTQHAKVRQRPYDPLYRVPAELVIRKATLTPGMGERPAQASLSAAPTARAPVRSTTTDGGYRVQALLPLADLDIRQAGSGKPFLIDVELVGVGADGVWRSGTVFGSTRPETDNTMFGRINGTPEPGP